MSLTRYGYRDAISGFFEFPTDNARRILPRGFEPVEPHHGTSILAITVFDFDESEVGSYGEVVYAVIVPPLVSDGRLPKSAFFPWQVATTSRAAREHAIERWRLPHWMEDVEVAFERAPGSVTARVAADGAPALELTITEHSWQPVSHLYQSFQKDEAGTYLANILFEGEKSEHEEEAGSLVLHDSEFNRDIVLSEVYETPFRELWMRKGCQLFDPLATLPR
ncbi:MAG: hypothetical protein ACM3PV_03060 [Betaproteobacteria bacterium]